MFSQEGSALRLDQTWALITQQALAGRGTGWPARGGQHLCSRRGLSLSVSLSSCLLTDFLPADCFFFFFVLVSFSLSCQPPCPVGLWNFLSPLAPIPPELGEGWQQVSSWVPVFTILWLSRYYLLYFSSHLPSLGGKVATGNWPRICLPPFSDAPSPPSSLSLASPSVSSIPPVAPEAIWSLSSPPPSLLSQRRPV